MFLPVSSLFQFVTLCTDTHRGSVLDSLCPPLLDLLTQPALSTAPAPQWHHLSAATSSRPLLNTWSHSTLHTLMAYTWKGVGGLYSRTRRRRLLGRGAACHSLWWWRWCPQAVSASWTPSVCDSGDGERGVGRNRTRSKNLVIQYRQSFSPIHTKSK